ncbi:MAG: nitroreductase family protein [Dehalococcoidales bacterium]
MLRDLIVQNRSCRRFHQESVDKKTLEELVDLARLSATGGNRQSLKFLLSWEPETNDRIFPLIGLAGNPGRDEAPTAYIIILGDTAISAHLGCDHGIAAQSILLGATEIGLGGCMVGIIDRKKLRAVLEIPDRYEIALLLIIGKPKEQPVIDVVPESGEVRGWWDDDGVRHVPKRALDEIILAKTAVPS